MTLESKLIEAVDAMKNFRESFAENLENLQKQVDAIDVKRQHIDLGGSGATGNAHQIAEMLQKHAADFHKFGSVKMDVPGGTLLSTKATQLSDGLPPYQHQRGIFDAGRRAYRVRDFLMSEGTTAGSVHYIKETAQPSGNAASQSPEGSEKSEVTFNLADATKEVVTIAAHASFSKQILDDLTELRAFVGTSLFNKLEQEVEEQILFGAGTSGVLSGFITNDTAFNASLATPGGDPFNLGDTLLAAALQLELAGFEAGLIVLSPQGVYRLRIEKDSQGRYLRELPSGRTLWDIPIVSSQAMSDSEFFCVDPRYNRLRPRMDATLELSREHDQNFVKNRVTALAEERLVLLCTQQASIIHGDLQTSPA